MQGFVHSCTQHQQLLLLHLPHRTSWEQRAAAVKEGAIALLPSNL
jgi:hypothetical protein